jgi:hypothetical protein
MASGLRAERPVFSDERLAESDQEALMPGGRWRNTANQRAVVVDALAGRHHVVVTQGQVSPTLGRMAATPLKSAGQAAGSMTLAVAKKTTQWVAISGAGFPSGLSRPGLDPTLTLEVKRSGTSILGILSWFDNTPGTNTRLECVVATASLHWQQMTTVVPATIFTVRHNR